jgi:hypothetical protein
MESFKVHEFQLDPRISKDDSGIAAGSLEDPLKLKVNPLTHENFQRDPRISKDDSEIAAALLETLLETQR